MPPPWDQAAQSELGRSVLIALWSEAEAPLQEEVRLGLSAAFPGLEVVDDLDAAGSVIWGFAFRIPGHAADVVIFAESRDEAGDVFDDEGAGDDVARGRIAAARYVLATETTLARGAASAGFHLQLKILDAACVAGFLAVYDETAVVARPAARVREMASAVHPPRPAALYSIHEAEEGANLWLHTHGLFRLWLPEVELIGLSTEDAEEGFDLIDGIVDVMAGGCEPDRDGVIAIAEDVEVRLVPVADAMPRLSDDARGFRAFDAADQEHPDPRVAVLSRDGSGPPHDVLLRLRAGAVLFKSRGETERQHALALERFGVFGQLFAMHRDEGWRFHAKLSFAQSSENDVREHLWAEVLELSPGRLRARILNDPAGELPVDRDEDAWFDVSRITDWLVVAPSGNFDPETAGTLFEEPR